MAYGKKIEPVVQKPKSNKCKMSGCPLAGTMSDDTRGGGSYWCQYHFRQRDPGNFLPEEMKYLQGIAYQYNLGKREYEKGKVETREEYLQRKLSESLK